MFAAGSWLMLAAFMNFALAHTTHAVVEAAILATRIAFLPLEEIEADYRKLAVLVEKTGGEQERAAFDFLSRHLQQVKDKRGS
jgi:hypothetical protein